MKDERRKPIRDEYGVWALEIFDDQPIAEGKKYAADNRIVVTKAGEPFREFLYPGYRIWTLLAHWTDDLDPVDAIKP